MLLKAHPRFSTRVALYDFSNSFNDREQNPKQRGGFDKSSFSYCTSLPEIPPILVSTLPKDPSV